LVSKKERFLINLIKFGNIPYIWGGDDPKVGLDCSGLSQAILRIEGHDPPGDDTADILMKRLLADGGKEVGLHEADLLDQVFYGSGKATHVVTYLLEGLTLGANGGGSWCTTPEIARQRGAFVRVEHIHYRNDLIKIVRPKGLVW
jgi:cell wall-associated NlpC family hydrolase